MSNVCPKQALTTKLHQVDQNTLQTGQNLSNPNDLSNKVRSNRNGPDLIKVMIDATTRTPTRCFRPSFYTIAPPRNKTWQLAHYTVWTTNISPAHLWFHHLILYLSTFKEIKGAKSGWEWSIMKSPLGTYMHYRAILWFVLETWQYWYQNIIH